MLHYTGIVKSLLTAKYGQVLFGTNVSIAWSRFISDPLWDTLEQFGMLRKPTVLPCLWLCVYMWGVKGSVLTRFNIMASYVWGVKGFVLTRFNIMPSYVAVTHTILFPNAVKIGSQWQGLPRQQTKMVVKQKDKKHWWRLKWHSLGRACVDITALTSSASISSGVVAWWANRGHRSDTE